MFNFLFIAKWYFFGRLKIGRKSRKKNAFIEFNRALSNLNKGSYVIDCGANIGMSITYFKRLYPKSKIIGFEPDPKIFETLKKNIRVVDGIEIRICFWITLMIEKRFRYRHYCYAAMGMPLVKCLGNHFPFH